jgi:diketogulonate reductase-like aldo/keto reductase
LHP